MKALITVCVVMGCLLCLNNCSSKPKQQEKLITHNVEPKSDLSTKEATPLSGKEQHLAKAQEYVEAEQYEQAIKELQNALQFDPKDANIYYTMGSLYEQMGKNKESVEAYIKAIQLDPERAEKTAKKEEEKVDE